MPGAKNAKADEALAMYRQGVKLVEIARRLGVPEGTVRRWKCTQKWAAQPVKRKRGGQPGNHNATGAPVGSRRAEKYGFFTKYLPEETQEIFSAVETADPLELLWHNIQIQYAAIIRAQKIAYVKDQRDKTVEVVRDDATGTSTEVQEAWDKQANFLKAQSRAMDTLCGMIKRYSEMLWARSDVATEEQRLRIELLRERIRAGGTLEASNGILESLLELERGVKDGRDPVE